MLDVRFKVQKIQGLKFGGHALLKFFFSQAVNTVTIFLERAVNLELIAFRG